MHNQQKLDSYLNKVAETRKRSDNETIRVERQRRPSSRENSDTEQLIQDGPQSIKLVCSPFILIGPCDTVYSEHALKKVRALNSSYSKVDAINLITNNMKFGKLENISNLEQIKDDDFWEVFLPQLLKIILKHCQNISSSIKTLPANIAELIFIERVQALALLSCMFMGILPRQYCQQQANFGELMVIRPGELPEGQGKVLVRREKLKCLIGYFKEAVVNTDRFKEQIMFQRTSSINKDYMNQHKMDREMPLREVDIKLISKVSIEDYYCQGIMVDFANKHIGGGVLKNGAVQEEILFSIFPEAIISRLICEELGDDQAVIISGARRYSTYSGYSYSFRYQGPYLGSKDHEKSVITAIDATDFSKTPLAIHQQYCKKFIRREINKAYAGFSGVEYCVSDNLMPIVSGRWGCGAFKGDQQLKFMIQWIASSEVGREMVYLTESQEMVTQLRMIKNELLQRNTLDLLNILDEYYKFRVKEQEQDEKISLFEYIKMHVL